MILVYFLCKNCPPVKHSFFENLVEGSIPPPPLPQQKGVGAHYDFII